MQKSFFVGNIANDPELKGAERKALKFAVACNESIKDAQTGERHDVAHFFDCVVFGNRAEALAAWLRKGMHVSVEATPRQNRWTTDQGENRSRVEFKVDDIVVSPKTNGGSYEDGLYDEDQPM